MKKIYTHDIATIIVDLFEDVLAEHDLTVPVDEDEQEDRDNTEDAGRLFGTPYDTLLQNVEDVLKDALDEADVEYIPDEYSGTM